MTSADLLHELAQWREAGWLRRLDVAFARFIHELDPGAPASLLLAAAMTAHVEGRGHGALPLAGLAGYADTVLGWPPDGRAALRRAWADPLADAEGDAAGAPPPAWRSRRVLEIDPQDDTDATPLVLCRGLLYLRRHWRCESRVAAQVRARTAASAEPAGTAAGGFDPAKVRAGLDALFGPDGTEPDRQKEACAQALHSRFTIITGGPGTGKTYTAARLLVLLQSLQAGQTPLRVALAAPTGKAAARLRQSIRTTLHDLRDRLGAVPGIGDHAEPLAPARTLHALLGARPGTRRFRHDAANRLDVDLLIVDEASMVDLEMMAQLLEALPDAARLVLLGDKDQLASVEAGAVLGDLCRAPALARQTVVLGRSRRFDGALGALALALNAGDAESALGALQTSADGPAVLRRVRDASAVLPLAVDGREGAPGGYRDYLERVAHRPQAGETVEQWARSVLRSFDRFRLLTAVREGPWGVAGLNAAIERALAEAGLLTRRGEWYEGRPVIVTRNDPSLGVFNGDVGVVLRIGGEDSALRCCFLDGDELRSVSVARLADVETGFAMTVHKSQGSEFAHVLLVLPEDDAPVLTRELVYTGVTRASRALTLACTSPKVLTLATARLTRRVSGLTALLAAGRA